MNPGVAREVRIGWLLVGDERVASARIQGLCVHRELLRQGIRSEILNAPGSFDTRLHWKAPRRWYEAVCRRRDVLVFQKVESSRARRFARLARMTGTQVVFLQADVRPSFFYEIANHVVATSAELARQLQPMCQAPVSVIEDPIDLPRQVVVARSSRRRRLRVLWVGSHLNFPALEKVRPMLGRAEFSDIELVTLSDHPGASQPWSADAATAEMMAADLAVIPCLDGVPARAKSNNRLTLFMAVGLPVIASPIPSYSAVVEPGVNGFLAETSEDWAAALRALRDPELRTRIGAEARRTAWARFAPEVIAQRWEILFAQLSGHRRGVPVEERSALFSLER